MHDQRPACRLAGRPPVARVSPVEALGDATVEAATLGWVRLTIGVLLIPLGLLLTLGDVAAPGDSAADTAGSAVLVFVVALGCLGPLLLLGVVVLVGSRLTRQSTASGFLAQANTRANSQRLSSATTPLAMGVALAAVQVFGASTGIAGAQHQFEDGLRADHVLTAQSGAGVSRRSSTPYAVCPVSPWPRRWRGCRCC
ncbi:hypothetical protein NKG94_22390 [Micromonospora sp. M12]